MGMRKYRGVEINAAYIDMAKNLESVDDLIDELRDLQSTWNNLSLLGELTQVGAEISDTRHHFQELASQLTNFLVEQSTRQTVQLLASRAQNSIDILVRNLFERTADIGFLATDPIFTAACTYKQGTPHSPEALHVIRQRMANYVEKYSVYKNIILLDTEACTIVDLQNSLPTGLNMEWIKKQVACNKQYVEAFRPISDLVANGPKELVYAWKIATPDSHVGYIALVFNLEQESDALFSKIIGQKSGDFSPEWRVCGVCNAAGEVLISSNPQYVGTQQTIRLPANAPWGITQLGPIAYLACVRSTKGYQGYEGPGWRGFCLVPLGHAFGSTETTEQFRFDELKANEGLLDPQIEAFQLKARQIQKHLNQSIWNGNMTQRNDASVLGPSFGKTLLWEISRTGENTKTLFSHSLENLVQQEIGGFQTQQQARAMLAMDLMDRNLYERANDCRWWALNPLLGSALSNLTNPEAVQNAKNCLKHIHSLYTVYTNILLLDATGRVICDSTEQTTGMVVRESWVVEAMRLKNQAEYCVSKFENTALYDDRPTYIYAAAIFDKTGSQSRAIGAIALVFDSEPQFEAILKDSMDDSSGKAFGLIVDEQLRVISSTHSTHTHEGRLTLPLKSTAHFEKQKAENGFVQHGKRLIAYGLCNSGHYREYKSSSDKYQNNLTCIYGMDIGAVEGTQATLAQEICFDEFRQAGQKEQCVDIACFRVGPHWFGIDSQDAVEAFLCTQRVVLPNSPDWILGTCMHKNESVVIVDISKVLEPSTVACSTVDDRPQMVLLKTNQHSARIALVVNELGEIPSLPLSAIHESEGLNHVQGIVQGLVKTKDNLLVVLNIEKMIEQLNSGIKKAP